MNPSLQIGDVARRAGVTAKTMRHYERLGLLRPGRFPNGYRAYTENDVAVVSEIKNLNQIGISLEETKPFIDCFKQQHDFSCPSSLAAYRNAIDDLLRREAALREKRLMLERELARAAGDEAPGTPAAPLGQGTSGGKRPAVSGVVTTGGSMSEDEGFDPDALWGVRLPDVRLANTSGDTVALAGVQELGVLYFYPLNGRPGHDLPLGWDEIPGARGCTPEACGFRDHFSELRAASTKFVYGVSSQSSEYQREFIERLGLPFDMLSDRQFELADALNIPTFYTAESERFYSRLTLILRGPEIIHAFYPVEAPGEHAAHVVEWLSS